VSEVKRNNGKRIQKKKVKSFLRVLIFQKYGEQDVKKTKRKQDRGSEEQSSLFLSDLDLGCCQSLFFIIIIVVLHHPSFIIHHSTCFNHHSTVIILDHFSVSLLLLFSESVFLTYICERPSWWLFKHMSEKPPAERPSYISYGR
jgi:hypothetical protein